MAKQINMNAPHPEQPELLLSPPGQPMVQKIQKKYNLTGIYLATGKKKSLHLKKKKPTGI